MIPLSYSIVIRTLGLSGEKFVAELNSITKQTISPKNIIIYIPQGYTPHPYTIGAERYVYTQKGMITQRVLNFDEIDSDFILLLDDDIELNPNCAEHLISEMITYNYDCIGIDLYQNHKMSLTDKIYCAITNFTIPHFNKKWALKILPDGSISYNYSPIIKTYESQSAVGGASFWKKNVLKKIRIEDETWLEQFSSFADDQLIFYKTFLNGYKLGLTYNNIATHLDGKSGTASYHASSKRFFIRTQAQFIIWHRCMYNSQKFPAKFTNAICFICKTIWLIPIHAFAALRYHNFKILIQYIAGLINGFKFIRSSSYRNLPNYITNN